jgi:hypothetical protein
MNTTVAGTLPFLNVAVLEADFEDGQSSAWNLIAGKFADK